MDDLNVATDVALCRGCNLVHKLSSLVQAAELGEGVDFNRPPAGAWYRSSGLGVVIGATHRSWGTVFGLLAVSLFWNGIVSVFVFLAINATLHLLRIPTPQWFPAPKMNGSDMGVGMTIFLWLFLTPFILIGLAMAGAFLSALAGRTEVRVQHSEGVVYSGIGPQAVKEVRIDLQQSRTSDGKARSKKQIVIEMPDGKLIKFGSMLREDRMKFVAAALRKAVRR
jgi:hypothetical protein